MILCSDKATLVGQYKCGTKGMEYLERKVLTNSDVVTNEIYGYDLINILSCKHIPEHIHRRLSDYNLTYLSNLVYNENKLPFVIFVRDPYKLYRAQVIQSIREFCKKNPSIDISTTLASTNELIKEEFFKNLVNIFPKIEQEIFTDMHYSFHTFNEILNLVLFLKSERTDIFNNIILLNLDDYDKSEESLNLLDKCNIIVKEYLNTYNKQHSTRHLFFPEVLIPEKISEIFRFPFKQNLKSLNLLSELFSDKFYCKEKLERYRTNHLSNLI